MSDTLITIPYIFRTTNKCLILPINYLFFRFGMLIFFVSDFTVYNIMSASILILTVLKLHVAKLKKNIVKFYYVF